MARTQETKPEWIVHGHQPRRPWVMLVIVGLIIAAVVIAYLRFMNFQTVTYELRACTAPLTVDSTWSQIEAAGCEPIDASDVTMVVFEERSRHDPDQIEGGAFSFEGFPMNNPAHSFEITGTPPHDAGFLVDPEGQQIRRQISSNAAGTDWSGYTGDRGPTTYWVLFTPEQ